MAAKKRSTTNGAPEGFAEVDNSLIGFWRPDEVGQTLQGIVSHDIETKGAEGKPNRFYAIRITDPDRCQGITTSSDEDETSEVTPERGRLVGAGGAMLLAFLAGREGQEVYLIYKGLGPKKGGKNPAKLYATYARGIDSATGEVIGG